MNVQLEEIKRINTHILKVESKHFNTVFGSESAFRDEKIEMRAKLKGLYADKFDTLERLQLEIEKEKADISMKQARIDKQFVLQ